MSGNNKNPLSVILGAFLKRERNILRFSSSKIADQLKLGDSIYRMIEAGSANININRLSLIVATFENSRIKFDRLSKFVAAIQILDFELSENSSLKNALKIIAERDEDLEYFLEKTKTLYFLSHGSDDYKRVMDEIAVKELEFFLFKDNYRIKGTPEFKVETVETFLDVPSIEMPNIITFLKFQGRRQTLHVGPTAKEWEEDERESFRMLKGVYKDPHIIIKDSNLEMFLYDYLLEEKFISLEMIFITDIDSTILEQEFIKKLNLKRKTFQKMPVNFFQRKKIKFKTIKNSNKEIISLIQPLLKGREDIFPMLKAYWNFTHESGVEIGFVGGDDNANNYAINLSYRESLERVKLFEGIWSII